MPNCLERISTKPPVQSTRQAKELRNLRDAKATHREKWLQRLRDAAVRWEEQLKQHTDQQSKATMPPWPRKSSWNSKQQDTPCLPSTRKQQMCMEILQKLRKLCQIRRTRTTMQKYKSLRSRCTRALTLRHGDYVGIAVPPFEQPLLPAYFAVKACQAGLSRSQTIRHVQVYGADEDRLHPAVEAAQEAAPHDIDHPEDCADEATLFQIAPRCAVKLDGPPSDPITFERSAPGAYQGGGPYDDEPLPAWTSAFHAAFIDSAAVECEEEGPIGYVESCNMVLARHKTLFHRGVQNLKADQFQQHWKDQLIDLWRDHIRWTLPLLFHWVQPTPRALITRDRIGHLILQQEPLLFLVPTVVTIDFQGTHRAALVLQQHSLRILSDHIKCEIYCGFLDRRCDLRFQQRLWQQDEAVHVPPGAGLVFTTHPPLITNHITDSMIATVAVQPGEPLIPAIRLLMNSHRSSHDLHERWLQFGRDGPAGLERVLRIQTWYLEGGYVRHNDEQRSVVLGDTGNGNVQFWHAGVI